MISTSFTPKDRIAQMTAKMLLEIEAVHFRPSPPYMLTSGLASPVYIDCRKLISYPRIRSSLMDFGTGLILDEIGFETIDSVAGGETAGIPFAAWLADKLSLPMQYVRKKPKGFGRDAQIEGELIEGQNVLLVEDLTTDGGSKVKFAKALRDAGAQCNHVFVVFFYDIFPQVQENMDEMGLKLHYLATWRDVLAVAKANNYFDNETLHQVELFLDDPLTWSANNGGASEISSAPLT